ncbi:hypothetical protein Lalb_Chr02g0154251 [Lupinus albus]|uniref:Uncharacterized protein n=1 Tax=Lupinus albus TaxID=3870 RepID=A0A6A4QXI3_LUPAL|nr:hypothetical protein Lalb_Chr02g0154251 [Lupinus albus]
MIVKEEKKYIRRLSNSCTKEKVPAMKLNGIIWLILYVLQTTKRNALESQRTSQHFYLTYQNVSFFLYEIKHFSLNLNEH